MGRAEMAVPRMLEGGRGWQFRRTGWEEPKNGAEAISGSVDQANQVLARSRKRTEQALYRLQFNRDQRSDQFIRYTSELNH